MGFSKMKHSTLEVLSDRIERNIWVPEVKEVLESKKKVIKERHPDKLNVLKKYIYL